MYAAASAVSHVWPPTAKWTSGAVHDQHARPGHTVGSTEVTDLASLAQPGVKLVIGAAGVPVGDRYTRNVLPALDASQGAGGRRR